MRFDILTLFPEVITPYISSSILKRAVDKEILTVQCHQIRDHALDAYGHVDDTLYGGGTGMLLAPEPVYQTWLDAVNRTPALAKAKRRTVFLSPKGRLFTQEVAKEYTKYDQVILLCGHYEGVDQRVLDEVVDEELSVGDYVLTGGELGALIVIDATSRMQPGVLPEAGAYENDSLYNGLLESRQYTKPAVWHHREVPEVLLGGHHEKIEQFRRNDELSETLKKRPDLFDNAEFTEETLIRFLKDRKEKN